MPAIRRLVPRVLVALLILVAQPALADDGPLPEKLRRGSGFDFYVLALSWSPTWCAANDRDARTEQCDLDADNRFVVHGLWPQFERGYPASCRADERDVPRRYADALLPIMPSRRLIEHQWDKHGSCSGLSQVEYFATLAHAWKRVAIPGKLKRLRRGERIPPDEIEALFSIANPGLTEAGIAVSCKRGQLAEVRICMDRNLQYRACQEVDRRGCRGRPVNVPAPR